MPDRDETGFKELDRRSERGIDWTLTTFDGLRRAQHRAFMLLSLRAKLERLEQMADVAERLRLRPSPAAPGARAVPAAAPDRPGPGPRS